MTLKQQIYAQMIALRIKEVEKIGSNGPYDTIGENFALHCYQQAKFYESQFHKMEEERGN